MLKAPVQIAWIAAGILAWIAAFILTGLILPN